jgi:sulfur carrier protein ThiS adenylyltransferase
VEALDDAEAKTMLVEHALLGGHMVASASGMGGYGGPAMQKRRLGRLTLVGDFSTDVLTAPPLAPRVTEAAALLADAVLEFVLGADE